jgi:N5-glutamine AdoMet-dependent methyltransferase PrmC (HemK)-like protein
VSPAPGLRGTSIGDALHSAVTAIGACGSTSPRLDAELLLAGVLGVERARLVLDRDAELPRAAAPSSASRSPTSSGGARFAISSSRSIRVR